jgi:hypothetical protein
VGGKGIFAELGNLVTLRSITTGSFMSTGLLAFLRERARPVGRLAARVQSAR